MPSNPNIKSMSKTGKANFMLYGSPGCGKTCLITEDPNTLIIRPPTDHTDAALRMGHTAQEWIVETWDDMIEVEEYARHNPGAHSWIWLDSLSLAQDHLLEDIMQRVIVEKPHRANTPISPGEYGENMEKIKKWCRHMVGMPGFNFGIVCHPAELPNNMGDDFKLRPWVQGKSMSFTICGYMNVVGYMEVRQGKRVIRLSDHEKYDAKDQLGLGGDKGRMVEPSMSKIMAVVGSAKPVAKRRRIKTKKG